MNASCSKCGSTEVLADIPVVTSMGSAVAAIDSKHRFLARVCGSCGFAEFYVEDPKGFVAVTKRAAVDA
jgi:predicted nucleic-acid-binding Zn-ribbon protein